MSYNQLAGAIVKKGIPKVRVVLEMGDRHRPEETILELRGNHNFKLLILESIMDVNGKKWAAHVP